MVAPFERGPRSNDMVQLLVLAVIGYFIWAWVKGVAERTRREIAEQAEHARKEAERALTNEASELARAAVCEHGTRASFDMKTWRVNFFAMTLEHSYQFAGAGVGIGERGYCFEIRYTNESGWQKRFDAKTHVGVIHEIEHEIVEKADPAAVGELREQLAGVKANDWRPLEPEIDGMVRYRFPKFEMLSKTARPEVLRRARDLAANPQFS